MHQIKEPAEALQGVGLFGVVCAGLFFLWYGVGYLFGDTDRRRTPLQNLFRRLRALLRWGGAVFVGVSCGIDAGLAGYYQAMRKPLQQPRNERVRAPHEKTVSAPVTSRIPAWRWKRKPEKVA